MNRWRILNSRIVFDARPFFAIRQDECQLPAGHIIPDYYVLESTDIVMVCAVTAAHEVLLVEQYKHGAQAICLELPAGMCDADSDPLTNARRELSEETGYTSDNWQHLITLYASPTRMNARAHFFLARAARQTRDQHLDPTEAIQVHKLPLQEALALAHAGRINASDALACLLLAAQVLAT